MRGYFVLRIHVGLFKSADANAGFAERAPEGLADDPDHQVRRAAAPVPPCNEATGHDSPVGAGIVPSSRRNVESDPRLLGGEMGFATGTIERAYIRSFFDLWLKNTDDHLLSGPSAQYPEVKFY